MGMCNLLIVSMQSAAQTLSCLNCTTSACRENLAEQEGANLSHAKEKSRCSIYYNETQLVDKLME